MKYLKKIIYIPFFFIFLIEIFFFKIFKLKNSEYSYQYLIKLFQVTGGISNKIIARVLSFKKDVKINHIKNINNAKIITDSELIIKNVNNLGYHFEPNFLRTNQIQEIKKFLNTTKGVYSGDEIPSLNLIKEYYNYDNPKGVRFVYSGSDLINNSLIQNLALDCKLMNIAQEYLGCLPILDIVGAWWSAPSAKPDVTAAQLWHFDMDRPSWIKIFIYLTDCNKNNGPHKFIIKSHHNNGIPFALRSKGYERLDDNLINKYYDEKLIKEFTAKEGDLLIEDSRGLHKGQQLKEGRRLILNFQYSSSVFGAKIPKIKYPENMQTNMAYVKENIPIILSNFY
jgi:hypothetical protein